MLNGNCSTPSNQNPLLLKILEILTQEKQEITPEQLALEREIDLNRDFGLELSSSRTKDVFWTETA